MELTDLRVEKFNKVADISNLSSPDVLSQLTVMEKFEYAKNVHSFHGTFTSIQDFTIKDTITKFISHSCLHAIF